MTKQESIYWQTGTPDSCQTVLIFSPSADSPIFMGYFDDDEWHGIYEHQIGGKVTHWAALPEGPK